MSSAADWQMWLPLAKAVETEDGRLWIEGIASDESVDLENEIVKASGLADTLQILEERGALDWDHGRIIGGIEKAALIPAEEAALRFPEVKDWYGRDFMGRQCFFVRAWVDPPVTGEPVNQDLLDARHTLKAGHRLGFSLAGGRLKRGEARGPDGRVYPATEQAIITRVALTPCPVNQNTVARMAKSLSAAMQAPEGDGPVWVVAKGLTAGGGTDHATFAGGRAMSPESMGRKVEDTLWGCATCATTATTKPDDDVPPRCRVCGGEMVRKDRRRKPVRKGLSALQRIAHDLDATEEDQTMADELERATKKLRKSVFGTLARVFGKAADLDEDELEDVEDEVEDVEDELGDLGGGEDLSPEEGAEDDEPQLGVEDEEDAPPGEAEVDDLLAKIEDADQVPALDDDEDEEAISDEDDDEEDRPMGKLAKGIREYLAEQEGGEELVQVLEAEGLMKGVTGAYNQAVGSRLDGIERALAQSMEAQAQIAELLGEALPNLSKSVAAVEENVEEVREVAQARSRAIGAMPAGTKIRKSAYDGAGEESPDALGERITKGVRSGSLKADVSGKLRLLHRRGEYGEVAAILARHGA